MASDLAQLYQSKGDLQMASQIMHAAVQMDPHDHELLYALASLEAAMGARRAAREILLEAAELYPLCPKPHIALGSMLLGLGRPRGALRRFERALLVSPDPKDDDAWDAAVKAGACGVRLARSHPHRAAGLLPLAEARLRTALQGARPEARERIESLLQELERVSAAPAVPA